MNVAAAIYAAVDHAKVAVFLVIHRVVLLVVPDIPPLRVHLIGVNAVLTIQETVLPGTNSAVRVVRQRVQKILLRPVFKPF